jgi:hypothetical protein
MTIRSNRSRGVHATVSARAMPSAIISWVTLYAMPALGWPPEPNRATQVSRAEHPILPRDLAGTVAYASVDPALEGRALQDALRGDPMDGTDTGGIRHPRCARFLAGLNARRVARNGGDAIAAWQRNGADRVTSGLPTGHDTPTAKKGIPSDSHEQRSTRAIHPPPRSIGPSTAAASVPRVEPSPATAPPTWPLMAKPARPSRSASMASATGGLVDVKGSHDRRPSLAVDRAASRVDALLTA